MKDTTVTVIDSSVIDDDQDAGDLNPDLIPIEIDNIDDDDDNGDLVVKQITPDQIDDDGTPIDQTNQTNQVPDLITSLLKEKGIDDPHSILFEEEDGTTSTLDFYELTPEEQFEILNSNDLEVNYGLENHEVEAINYLRDNNVTLPDLIEYLQTQAVEEYKKSSGEGVFEIDAYSDEELYVLDQKTKFEEFTDDELTYELDRAKENPDLFKKKVDKIRAEYKQLETQEKESIAKEQAEQEDQVYTQMANSVIDVANDTEDMYGIILEDNDKEDIVRMITDRDINGINPLVKALDDPNALFKAAWFLSKGDEAFEILHNYYKKQIDETRKVSYQKGKDDSIKGMPTKPINIIGGSQKQVLRQNSQQQTKFKSIDDLYND